MKVREKTEATKSRRAITQAASNRLIMPLPRDPPASLASISRAALSPAMATKASCRPRPLDRQLLDPGAAVDQRLQQRLDAGLGQLELPEAVALARVGRQRVAPRARPALRGLEADLRPQPVARLG